MRTVETTAVITPEGKLIAQVPKDISPGECQVVLVIEEHTSYSQLQNDIAAGIDQADRGDVLDGEEVFRQFELRNQTFGQID